MADMTLALRLIADARSAIEGLRQTAAEVRGTGVAAKEAQVGLSGLDAAATRAGDSFDAALAGVSASMAETLREIDLLKAKLAELEAGGPRRLPDVVDDVGQSARGAAGQVGNLAAQFNDIAMMMAAGQNPLMTAIQQGSQVGQVLGPMGAAGAVKALGAGFLAMLNPLNLVIYAAIAFGSTLVQWLVSGGEEAKALEDAVADLEARVTAFQKASSRSLEDLRREYGALTPEIRRLNDEMADLAWVQGINAATEAMRSLKAETEGSWWALFTDKAFTDLNQAADLLQVDAWVSNLENGFSTRNNPIVEEFIAAVDDAIAAQGLDAQIKAWGAVKAIIIEAAGGIDSMNGAQLALLEKVKQTENALRSLKAAQTSGITPQGGRAEAGYVLTPDDVKALADLAAARQEGLAATREEIAENERLAALQRQIAAFGEDSARATYARLSSERDAYAALLDQRGVMGDLKDEAMAAWDAKAGFAEAGVAASREAEKARAAAEGLAAWLADGWTAAEGIAGADMEGNLGGALGAAKALAGWLWEAARARMAIAANEAASGPAFERGGRMGNSPGQYIAPPKTLDDLIAENSGTGAGAGASGIGSSPLADLQAQARETMVELDQAIAAIGEKVAVGLIGAADAADGVTDAKRRAADQLAELIAELDDLGPAGQQSAAELRVGLQGMADELKAVGTVGEAVGKTLGESLKSPLADFMLGTKSAAQAFDDFVGGMARTIANRLAGRFTDAFVSPLIDSFVGSIFPGLKLFAKGGVPGGGVPGIGAFSNQVLQEPTLFAMPGGGLGEAGEAGKEAIMPLKDGPGGLSVRAWMGGDEVMLGLMRGPDGNLGVKLPAWSSSAARAPHPFALGGVPGSRDRAVALDQGIATSGPTGRASGEAAARMTVNIINNAAGTQVRETRREQGGELVLDVVIDTIREALAGDIVGGRGPVPAALEGTYGAQRMGR